MKYYGKKPEKNITKTFRKEEEERLEILEPVPEGVVMKYYGKKPGKNITKTFRKEEEERLEIIHVTLKN